MGSKAAIRAALRGLRREAAAREVSLPLAAHSDLCRHGSPCKGPIAPFDQTTVFPGQLAGHRQLAGQICSVQALPAGSAVPAELPRGSAGASGHTAGAATSSRIESRGGNRRHASHSPISHQRHRLPHQGQVIAPLKSGGGAFSAMVDRTRPWRAEGAICMASEGAAGGCARFALSGEGRAALSGPGNTSHHRKGQGQATICGVLQVQGAPAWEEHASFDGAVRAKRLPAPCNQHSPELAGLRNLRRPELCHSELGGPTGCAPLGAQCHSPEPAVPWHCEPWRVRVCSAEPGVPAQLLRHGTPLRGMHSGRSQRFLSLALSDPWTDEEEEEAQQQQQVQQQQWQQQQGLLLQRRQQQQWQQEQGQQQLQRWQQQQQQFQEQPHPQQLFAERDSSRELVSSSPSTIAPSAASFDASVRKQDPPVIAEHGGQEESAGGVEWSVGRALGGPKGDVLDVKGRTGEDRFVDVDAGLLPASAGGSKQLALGPRDWRSRPQSASQEGHSRSRSLEELQNRALIACLRKCARRVQTEVAERRRSKQEALSIEAAAELVQETWKVETEQGLVAGRGATASAVGDPLADAGASADGIAGYHITSYHLNIALKGGACCTAARAVVQWGRQYQGIRPTRHLYATLIGIFGNSRDFQGVERVLEDAAQSGVPLDDVAYSRLMKVYQNAGMEDKALALLSKSVGPGRGAGVSMYTTAMGIHMSAGRFGRAVKLFKEMKRLGRMPDQSSYRTAIFALGKCGEKAAAMALLQEMEEAGLKLQVRTLNVVLDLMAKSGECGKAEEMFGRMRKDPDSPPNLWTYGIMLQMLGEQGRTVEAEELFRDMQGKGLKGDEVIWNTMIHMHASKDDLNGARRWMRDALRAGCPLNRIACNSLLWVYKKKGLLANAAKLSDFMRARGMAPNVYIPKGPPPSRQSS